MSVPEREQFDGDFSRERLYADLGGRLAVGLGVGIVVFGGLIGFAVVLLVISSLLPPESKEAVDPTPDSFSSYIVEFDKDAA
ncbi:MAG: hypothetical protein AAGF53_02830 [Pseudomonadota bacterium]